MQAMNKKYEFGSVKEAIFYPAVVLIIMWLVYWADHIFPTIHFYQYGVQPKAWNKFYGIIGMPWIHSYRDINHILNNSLPTFVLLSALIFYYRAIALRVFMLIWIMTGLGVFLFATNGYSYHVGMSGVIYGLAGFLFTSGVLRKYRPLQAISLFVVFVYGSLIWGIFPMETHVSWEGHLSGLVTGVLLAVLYRKKGPQSPKYQYEIEKELGIEPPDWEGVYNEKLRLLAEKEQKEDEIRKNMMESFKIVYHYKSSDKNQKNEN